MGITKTYLEGLIPEGEGDTFGYDEMPYKVDGKEGQTLGNTKRIPHPQTLAKWISGFWPKELEANPIKKSDKFPSFHDAVIKDSDDYMAFVGRYLLDKLADNNTIKGWSYKGKTKTYAVKVFPDSMGGFDSLMKKAGKWMNVDVQQIPETKGQGQGQKITVNFSALK